MHDAPAVSYPAGRCAACGFAIAAVWCAAAGGLALWWFQAQPAPALAGLALAALLACGLAALRAWRRSPAGTLSWDGAGWTWAAPGEAHAGAPEPALDAQRLLLVRWDGGAGRTRWLWLERRALPARWDDLRRAVYSRARDGEAKP